MFRRKIKTDIQNNVRRRPIANASNTSQTFSYRASRSRVEQATGRNEEIKPRTSLKVGWLIYMPTYLAVIVIVGCLVYASTLTGSPRVEVFGTSQSTIIRETRLYMNRRQPTLWVNRY